MIEKEEFNYLVHLYLESNSKNYFVDADELWEFIQDNHK